MQNSLCDLNDRLFTCLDDLMDDELSPEELKKKLDIAKAATSIGAVIVKNAATQLSAMKMITDHNLHRNEVPELLLPKNTSGRTLLLPGDKE